MKRDIPDFDIILDVLKQAQFVQPESTFISSLLQQYRERGSLSKKQLEGLHNKASKINTIVPGKLATLQAIINKKQTRYKSTITKPVVDLPDNNSIKMVEEILIKYPQHKRVQFFKLKLYKNDPFSAIEKAELEKFYKLLV